MLEARNIHKKYISGKKELNVLRGVDIVIEKGAFAAIVGPSGAGKSTLLHILGGLDSPSEGQVVFQGQDVYQSSDSELSRLRNTRIGFVFQFYHLMSEFTVLENVLMPAVVGSREPQARAQALKLLEEVGLGGRLNHFPNQLSGGEKQRVAMVRALINTPSLLLCDEPTGNLDSKTGDDIMSLIRKTSIENGMAVVLVTHNIELAKMSDKVYHLKDGLLVQP